MDQRGLIVRMLRQEATIIRVSVYQALIDYCIRTCLADFSDKLSDNFWESPRCRRCSLGTWIGIRLTKSDDSMATFCISVKSFRVLL